MGRAWYHAGPPTLPAGTQRAINAPPGQYGAQRAAQQRSCTPFERAIKDRIEIGKPGSGYILSSACSVAPHVKPERLKRLVDLSEELGKY